MCLFQWAYGCCYLLNGSPNPHLACLQNTGCLRLGAQTILWQVPFWQGRSMVSCANSSPCAWARKASWPEAVCGSAMPPAAPKGRRQASALPASCQCNHQADWCWLEACGLLMTHVVKAAMCLLCISHAKLSVMSTPCLGLVWLSALSVSSLGS